MYMDDLVKALDNDKNVYIMDLTSSKISQEKNDILQQIQLGKDILKQIHKKLNEYRYVSDINSLQVGSYIRWINLETIGDTIPSKLLTNGAVACDWEITDVGVIITCKTTFGRFMNINFDKNLIFQKLTEQELVLLSVIDYVNKA